MADTISKTVNTDFLAGGGEMGERIRAHGWANTPLGPISDWPQPLRMAVSLSVKSRFPIIIHWGWPSLTVLYNDAFLPFAGEKHPNLLGRPLFESWPELEPTLGPMLESVLTTGNAAMSDDLLLVYNRSGYPEETYYTLSFNPIVLECGKVGGSFSLIDYTTDRVIGERRLRTLRDLAARSGDAKEAEEACRIAADVLGANRYDLPFALVYLLGKNRKQVQLVATVGLEAGEIASPLTVELTTSDESAAWPLARVTASNKAEQVCDLEKRFGRLPGGPWSTSPQSALVLPITPPGHQLPVGVLVAALSPHKALDNSYRIFLNSVAAQIAATLVGVIAYQSLAELDQAKTTFFSNVSHEFRTPLTLLLGPLEEVLGRKGGSLEPKDREALDVAHRNTLRLQKLVNSLLEFSRIEAGRVRALYEPTDVATLTADLAGVFRSAIERAGMRLVVKCPPLTAPVYVDRDMWEKIVLNLLSNAFKYTFEGEIRIALRQVDDTIELSVSDTGVGIPEHELSRIFERFHRVEGVNGRTVEGTGIGLALVQELVKLQGGTISATSSAGRGSAFTVSVPLGKDHLPAGSLGARKTSASTATSARAFLEEALRWLPEAPSGTHPTESPALSAEEIDQLPLHNLKTRGADSKPRILLADDNADMRSYVRGLLGEGYEITTAADGEAALAELRQNPPDLVLTDVMMPRLDGFELLKAIRSDSATSTTPVILLTARAGEESKVEGLDRGADDYLAKPFSARELTARVAAHVALARLRKEATEREAQEKRAADLRLVIDSIPGLVNIMTAKGEIEFANQQSLNYFGMTLEELTGWAATDVVHQDDLSGVIAAWKNSVETGQPLNVEHRLRGSDGVYRWFHGCALPLRDLHGRIVRWYSLVTDVDDRKRAEEKLEKAFEEIKRLKDRLHGENLALREQIDQVLMFEEIVGSSPVLQTVLTSIVKVAPTDSTVLISGETGTGKELIARAIHKGSRRSGQPFISVNCAAIPPSLIASELFGHEKGAFTGALQQRQGRFELAHSGTIFLDEVGELPGETQVALLRVLQERQFERVGGNKTILANVRVIAATNRDLSAAIAAGTFRADLFYRLNVFPVQVPPLRQRKEDIPMLVEYFVKRFAENMGKQINKIDKKTLELCQRYHWPGNIRELQNIVERSVILSGSETFRIDEAWLSVQAPPRVEGLSPLEETLQNQEKEIIEAALAESKGRVAGPNGAAIKLGIPRSTLDRKIQQLKIKKRKFTPEPQ